MAITKEGYSRRTYQEILDDKIALCKEYYGEDIDTRDISVLGKYIRINAYDQSETEETAEAIYLSISPMTATGTSLDRLCPFVGISRNPATASQYTVQVTGTAGATVPDEFMVGTEGGITFYNVDETIIGEDGTCTIKVECSEAGTNGNVAASDICVIVNPDANITAILGVECVTLGTDTESDVSLRQRFMVAREGAGSCTTASIAAALARIETVTSASVVVNETDEADADGRPPFSFECYVSGGENKHDEIAQTIFEKKPLGIKTYGDETVTITDKGGYEHIIKFSHTGYIDIIVSCKIKVSANYEGETGKKEIQNNIASYINGLGVGKSVILSSLYGQIHAVTGVTEVTELTLSKDGGATYSADNIDAEIYQIARCVAVNIEVVA